MKLIAGLQSMIRKLLAALAFMVLVVLGLSQAPVNAQSTTNQASYNFEFLDLQNNYQLLSTYPQGRSAEIVVASQNADVRNLLPISLVITINGKVSSRGTISNNPQSNCRGADGCSIKGPNITSLSENDSFKLTATDKDGNLVATHTQGSQPQAKTPVSQSTQKTEPLSNTNQVTTQVITYTWWLPLIFGLMWLGLWGFVGRQWWNLGFWNFRWPRPVWFFMPLFMMVPWLFWGLFGLFNIWWPWNNGWWFLAWGLGLGSLGAWLFYGWWWRRKKLAVFKWPGFLWYLIPLFWFVPWFLWWPFNWLGWGGGWFWAWWWMFPWSFWLPWWIIVYKEKEIWLWNKIRG